MISKLQTAPGGLVPGRTKDQRDSKDFVVIEKKEDLLPVNGLSLATGTRATPVGAAKRGRGRGKTAIALPPPWVNPAYRFRYLFKNSSVALTAITRGSLGMSLGAVCSVANSTLVGIASSFRIRHVRVWPAPSTSAVNSCALFWGVGSAEQALQKDTEKLEVLPEGVSVTGVLTFRPPRGSFTSMWQVTNENPTDTMWTITCAIGSIIEIVGEFTLATAQGAFGQNGYAAASLGSFYYPYLDGPASHLYAPFLPTTF